MYFNFDDAHPETPTIERAISLREGVLFSVAVHAGALLLILFAPHLPFVQAVLAKLDAARQEAVAARLEQQREAQDRPTFVFVQPRVDTPAPGPPPRAELSDLDRAARAPEQAENPTNPLPFARGNSAERVEGTPDTRTNDRSAAADEAASASAATGADEPRGAMPTDRGRLVAPPPGETADGNRARGLAGAIGEALRNIEKYVPESFNNPQGGVRDFGSTIQFDTKGVEFGPWIRRFVAQVKRNWFIPYAAMSMRGHVVLQFYVHRDGSITDLTVVQPSSVDAFTNAAYNAMASSNPTQPLPPEYPSDKVLFTVTFLYNELPGGGEGV
jgi:TonB family protein